MAIHAAVAKAATPARDGARKLALQAAIEKGGSNCATLLRRWAKEGRPYRGQVFLLEEVEEAVAAAKVAADKSQRSGDVTTVTASSTPNTSGQTVLLKAKNWPTPELLEGAVSVAGALGPLGKELTKDSARLALLRALYEPSGSGTSWGKTKHADVQVVAGSSSTQVGGHKAMLAAVSQVLQTKFGGSFGDASDMEIDASSFKEGAVRAALEFTYTGQARLPVADLGDVCGLADYWQFDLLSDAVERSWMSLPIVCALEVLSSLDESFNIPATMIGALRRALEANFSRLADLLSADQVSFGAVQPSKEKVEMCWRFVQELQVVLEKLGADAMERLRKWLSADDELETAAERFMLTVVKAAAHRGHDELKNVSKRCFKAWLPEAMLSRIIAKLVGVKTEDGTPCIGFCDAAKQPLPWLPWIHRGGPTLEAVFQAYLQLLDLAKQEAERAAAAAADGLIDTEADAAQPFPAMLHTGFAVAFVDEAFQDPHTSSVWDMMLARHLEDHLPAVEEAMQVLARHTLRSKKMPTGLPLKVVLQVMAEAIARAPAAAIQIYGPKDVAGVYERKGSAFLRTAPTPMVLRRVARATGREAINVVWKGIPTEEFHKALADWKVQRPEDDEQLDVPLAVALSAAQEPCNLGVNWWLRTSSGKFQQDPSLQICLHSIREEEALACKAALATWARAGGSLTKLEEAARKSSEEVALPMLCQAVSDMTATSETIDVVPSGVVEEKPRKAQSKEAEENKEEDDKEWQEAAKTFDAAAEELCRILQEARNASADERRRLLQKKRSLEEAPDFVSAVQRLEMPLKKR